MTGWQLAEVLEETLEVGMTSGRVSRLCRRRCYCCRLTSQSWLSRSVCCCGTGPIQRIAQNKSRKCTSAGQSHLSATGTHGCHPSSKAGVNFDPWFISCHSSRDRNGTILRAALSPSSCTSMSQKEPASVQLLQRTCGSSRWCLYGRRKGRSCVAHPAQMTMLDSGGLPIS